MIEYLRQFLTEQRLQLIDDKLKSRTRHVTLVLEDIFQSQNGAACLRSAEAFGIQDIHVIENRNRFVTHKDVLRGASKWLTIHRYHAEENNTQQCLSTLKNKGYLLVATTPNIVASHQSEIDGISSQPDNLLNDVALIQLDDLDISSKVALMLGTEKTGLTSEAMSMADCFLTIPMCGFIESLNLSASAAICLYTLKQKLQESEIDWTLNEKEVKQLQAEWIRKSLGYRLEKLEREYGRRNIRKGE